MYACCIQRRVATSGVGRRAKLRARCIDERGTDSHYYPGATRIPLPILMSGQPKVGLVLAHPAQHGRYYDRGGKIPFHSDVLPDRMLRVSLKSGVFPPTPEDVLNQTREPGSRRSNQGGLRRAVGNGISTLI